MSRWLVHIESRVAGADSLCCSWRDWVVYSRHTPRTEISTPPSCSSRAGINTVITPYLVPLHGRWEIFGVFPRYAGSRHRLAALS